MPFLLFIIAIFFSQSLFAANIAVIDYGAPSQFLSDYSSRINFRKCYSTTDNSKTVQPTNSNYPGISYFYQYNRVSTCADGQAESGQIGHRWVRAHRKTTGQYETTQVTSQTHLANVAKTVISPTQNLGSEVNKNKLILFHTSGIDLGRDSNNRELFADPHTLRDDETLELEFVEDALRFINTNYHNLDIRVVNLSWGVPSLEHSRYTLNAYCDGRFRNFDRITEIENLINSIVSKDIAVVVATGNGPIDRNGNATGKWVDDAYTFPACLSSTIHVGAIDLVELNKSGPKQPFYGHTVNGMFVEHKSIYGYNQNASGTSITAPQIARYLAALKTVNPSKTMSQLRYILRDTANRYINVPHTVGSTTSYRGPFYDPHYGRARAAALSDETLGQYIDLIDSNSDSGKYGWNYGTRQHRNGVQIAVNTSSFNARSASQAVNQQPSEPNSSLSTNQDSIASRAATSTKSYYRFSLQAYDVDSVGELRVHVNDRFYGYVVPTGNNRTGSRQYFYIERSHLNANQINFIKVVQKTSGETYGVTNIQLAQQSLSLINTSKTSARITLSENENSTAYGYNGAGTYYSQLKTRVNYTDRGGIELSLRAHDFDQSNEVAIYVNNKFFTYISATGNNAYGNKTIEIPHEKLLENQWNNIDFRKAVRTDHKWVIDKLKATLLPPPSIAPILLLLLEDD